MNVYGWVFKLYVRFCVWQLSGKSILFFTLGQLTMPNFFLPNICFQWYQQASRIQLSEFNFLSVSKAIKAVSCIDDFGVSTAIITFFVGGASWTLDSSIEATICNTKLTKKFISVAVWYSFQQQLHN